MTINEIAKLAGVSASTVSKIMNNKDSSISAETREHVLKIAKEYPNKPYASVITSASVKSLCIGVIFRNTSEYTLSTSGILGAAREEGYSVIFHESALSPEQEVKNIMALINLPVIVLLGRTALSALKDYTSQRREGKDPVFRAASIGLKEKTDFWN